MLNWLVGNCEVFGVTGQNWMLVVGGGLLLYITMLIVARRRQPRTQATARKPAPF